MADNRTMAQMLQAPIEGYEDAIVVSPINANNFELKQPLINLVQSNKFRHLKVPNTSVKLLLFPFSLDGEARDWLDKEPPRSILTWDDLVSKFINQFFPPSKTTYLRNKITNFFQEPNETFNEAWERFKGLLRQCPYHGFSELHQLDTFYNSLNSNDSRFTMPLVPPLGAKKTVNLDPNSYQSKLPYPERMKVRENDKPSAQHSRFLKMFKQLRLEIGLKDALVEMPKFNKWLSSLLRNKEKLKEIANTTVNAECSAIIMNKVLEKLEDRGKFLIPCALQELNRTSALADSGARINLLPHSIYKKLELEALTPTRMTLELANRSITHPMGIAEDVVVRVDGFTFLADFVGKDKNLFTHADKSEKNKEKNFFHAISIIDFSKDDLFSGSTTNTLHPSSSSVKTSDNFKKFTDELTPLDSLPPGNDDSTLKKDLHEVNFQVYSNPLFEFDDNFKSSNVNPLFEENDKDVEIKSSSSFTFTSPEESEFEAYLERDSIPPGIDLIFSPTLEISSSNPTSPTLTGEKVCSWKTLMFFSLIRFVWKMMTRIAIRKKIICLLATYLHQQPKLLSCPQEVEDIKEKEDEVSSEIPIDTIVMPIRITFDNPIDFNDHFSKPKDFKKDLTVSFDSSESSILPSHLFDSDSPFTAELSASLTLNSLGNEDKLQLNELNELRDQAYENSLIYKEKTKKLHDSKIKNRIFNVGDQVLLFNSRLKIFSGKLKTRWSGPFTIAQVFPYGTVELSQPDGPNFKVNGHRVKHYFGGDIPPKVVPDLHTLPKDN
ncbi:reverse transcriptase domain-containing protein [Tanacetum coccineum]|uniref:Reverse transcriptase domain-containing protein n=1 Tax=Tanacetum coccineum TaxID=301880 RepID=A0ABQ5BCQ4_9ASTR